MPNEGFKEYKLMKTLIESESHLNNEEKFLKNNLYQKIDEIGILYSKLDAKFSDFSINQFDHFSNIRTETQHEE